MLNIEVNRSAGGMERYFDRELAVSDYLMKEPGIWAGRGAEPLGLRGLVQRSQFVALLRNENPTTGKRLTAPARSDGRWALYGDGWLRCETSERRRSEAGGSGRGVRTFVKGSASVLSLN
jgi:hypothetical protein